MTIEKKVFLKIENKVKKSIIHFQVYFLFNIFKKINKSINLIKINFPTPSQAYDFFMHQETLQLKILLIFFLKIHSTPVNPDKPDFARFPFILFFNPVDFLKLVWIDPERYFKFLGRP